VRECDVPVGCEGYQDNLGSIPPSRGHRELGVRVFPAIVRVSDEGGWARSAIVWDVCPRRREGRGGPQNLPLISQDPVVGGKKTCMQDNLGGTTQTCGAMRHDACAVQNMHGSMHDHQSVHACMAGTERTHGWSAGEWSPHTRRCTQYSTQHTPHTQSVWGCVCCAPVARLRLSRVMFATHTIKAFSRRQAPPGPPPTCKGRRHAHTLGGRGVDLWIISVNFKM
jgi:hypothetical protein